MRAAGTQVARRLGMVSAVVAAAAGALVVAAVPAGASSDGKVTLCHATGSATNPYVQITVDAAAAYNGHYRQHADLGQGDIIPPSTYKGIDFQLNWTSGQATWLNGCEKPTTPPWDGRS